jgi:hypothetical protein
MRSVAACAVNAQESVAVSVATVRIREVIAIGGLLSALEDWKRPHLTDSAESNARFFSLL